MVVAASRTSRNDIFSTSLSLPPLLPPGVLPASPACTTPPIPLKSPRLPTSSPSFAHYFDDTHIEVDIDTAAREPIVPSKNIELRLSPHHRLGNGRHAAVQLGAYRLVKGKEREDPSYASHTYDGRHGRGDSADSVEKNWKVCAGKRFSPDAESQIAGLSEAAMLLRLKDCENILKFIGLKDERDEEVAGHSKHATAAGAARGVALASRLAKPKLEHIVTGSTASFNGPDSRSLPPSPLAATSPATPTLGLAAIALNDIHEDDKPLAALASVRRSSTLGSRNSLSSLRDATPKSAREAVDSNGADAAPRLVLLTEYCALGNLATFTQHHGPVHLGRALFFKFAIDLMRAIEACHAKNVIHGDVKPHNCMIDGRLNIKLGDFSSSVFDSPALLDGIALGTTQYSPPELIKPPPSPFSFPVDIFSAGLTLLYMLTGVEPYESLAASSTRTSHGYASPAQSFTPTMNSGAGGCGTPTSSLSRSGSLKKRASLRKKRVRTSSGAGKMVELHLHLAKGHAWEWEERRRLDELEDEGVDEMVSFTSSNGFSAPTWSHEAEVEADETSTLRGEEAEQHYTLALPTLAFSGLPDDLEYPTSMVIPEHLREKAPQPEPVESLSHSRQRSRSISMMYSDGFTPKQTFLDGSGTVPESLRDLIKQMLSPQAADRPSAAAALHRLEQLRQN